MRTFLATSVLGAVLAGSLAVAQDKNAGPEPIIRENPAGELRTELRRLWSRQAEGTRHCIISSLAGLPDSGIVYRNLLKQQGEIAEFFRHHFGDEASTRLAELLRHHAAILADVVRAARGGNAEDLASQLERWDANGREVAGLLAGANPEWNRGRIEELILHHLDLAAEEISCRLKKDWVGDLGALEADRDHLLRFADVLTLGLARQFPDQFHDLP